MATSPTRPRATFDCLWCGRSWTTRSPDDLEGWAQLCPDCLGKAGENPFLRFRLRDAIVAPRRGVVAAERAGRRPRRGRRRPPRLDGRVLRGSGRRVRRLVPPSRPLQPRPGPRHGLERRARRRRDAGSTPSRSAARSSSSPPAPAGGRRSSRRGASSGSTTPREAPLERARERLLAHGLRAHIHVRDAWAEPDRRVDALFCGFWLSHVERDRHRPTSSPSRAAG